VSYTGHLQVAIRYGNNKLGNGNIIIGVGGESAQPYN